MLSGSRDRMKLIPFLKALLKVVVCDDVIIPYDDGDIPDDKDAKTVMDVSLLDHVMMVLKEVNNLNPWRQESGGYYYVKIMSV